MYCVRRVFRPLMLRPPSKLSSIRQIPDTATRKMSGGFKMSSAPKNPDVKYDLYRGHPNENLLPHSEMRSIMAAFIEGDGGDSWRRCLNYGANAGDERFHSALRSFLERRTKDDHAGKSPSDGSVTSSPPSIDRGGLVCEFFVTNGVSHGLELLCATLTQPGDEVWIERPTYFLASNIFKSNGLVVKSLPMMTDRSDFDWGSCIGCIDIDRLIRMVEEDGVSPPRMIYIIPSYHNPTGRLMAVAERRNLASFSLKHGIYLVADEVYHLLDWNQNSGEDAEGLQNSTEITSRRPAGIVHFNDVGFSDFNKASSEPGTALSDTKCEDRIGCCISVSSFTKIWAPGIRLGWIHAPAFVINQLDRYGYIDSQGGVAPLMGRIMTHAIESHLLDDYLDKLKLDYSERYQIVCSLLKEEPRILVLSQNSPVKRKGGYFIWVVFPPGVNGSDFLSYSLDNYGVKFMPGGRCDPFPKSEGDNSGIVIRSCARLCFADLDRDDLVKATLAFLEAFQSFLKSME